LKGATPQQSAAVLREAALRDVCEQMHDTQQINLSFHAKSLLDEQMLTWELARTNYDALAKVETRSIPLDGFEMRLQFNPARIASTGAKTDAKSIAERKCFLCGENRPKEQTSLTFRDDYLLLVNPFPIFLEHFTIPRVDHVLQRIDGSFATLLELARAMSPRYTVFYNGPKAGASAPDHLHFQAGDRRFMIIEDQIERLKGKPIAARGDAQLFAARSIRPFLVIESREAASSVAAFEAVYRALAKIAPRDDEPSMNVLAWFDAGVYTTIILPRYKHRPDFYYAEGDAKIMLSPGCVDLGGVCIIPVERDYHRITADHLRQMLSECMLSAEKFDALIERLKSDLK